MFVNRVWIAAMACKFFVEARHCGALEMLLTTRVDERVIRQGRRRALVRLFFWPVLVVAVLHYAYVWVPWITSTRPAGADGPGRVVEFVVPQDLSRGPPDVSAGHRPAAGAPHVLLPIELAGSVVPLAFPPYLVGVLGE